jgi:hypothetical protein
MDQKKSHNITPEADEMKSGNRRPTSERVRQQEREQAIISPDRGKPKKRPAKKGPLSVGVDFDHSQG